MRRTSVLGMAAAACCMAGVAAAEPAAPAGARELQEAFVSVAKKIEPVVVTISIVVKEKIPEFEFFFNAPPVQKETVKKVRGIGSGVIVSADGHILTNEHVVHGATEIQVTLPDRSVYKGRVVGRNAKSDLAVVKIEAGRKLPFAALGDSSRLRIGDVVIAMGFPFGLQQTLTTGVVSAIWKTLKIEGNVYSGMIQTDAPINEGNSGGALCNIAGEVIGINSAIFAPTGVFSGISFAIPINNAKDDVKQAIDRTTLETGGSGGR